MVCLHPPMFRVSMIIARQRVILTLGQTLRPAKQRFLVSRLNCLSLPEILRPTYARFTVQFILFVNRCQLVMMIEVKATTNASSKNRLLRRPSVNLRPDANCGPRNALLLFATVENDRIVPPPPPPPFVFHSPLRGGEGRRGGDGWVAALGRKIKTLLADLIVSSWVFRADGKGADGPETD